MLNKQKKFQSTPLTRGETLAWSRRLRSARYFNPLPSHEGRPSRIDRSNHFKTYFNPLPSHEGRPQCWASSTRQAIISIHSPHTRGDDRPLKAACAEADFNPLPSCEGRLAAAMPTATPYNFNPPPSCEGRPRRVERARYAGKFQSTPLTRGETKGLRKALVGSLISIHSPHTRGDKCSLYCLRVIGDFNPLPSHEGRPASRRRHCSASFRFQSTPLTRGETGAGFDIPLVGGHFNPLPSHEGRRRPPEGGEPDEGFQSTPLTRGETLAWSRRLRSARYFNPLPSHEGRQWQALKAQKI